MAIGVWIVFKGLIFAGGRGAAFPLWVAGSVVFACLVAGALCGGIGMLKLYHRK